MFRDGTIDHLEHAWMPQTYGTSDSFRGAIQYLLEAYASYHRTELSLTRATVKVDDAMSCLVKEQNGHYMVAYKAKNPVWHRSGDGLEDTAGGKDEKLHVLLKYAQDIIGHETGVQYQVGFMGYDPDGLPSAIRPNVIEYDLPDLDGQKLAVVIVTKSKIDSEGDVLSTIFDNSTCYFNTHDVYFYDNDLYSRKLSPGLTSSELNSTRVVDRLIYASYLMEFLRSREAWLTIVVDEWLQVFLNSKNRDTWDPATMYDEYLGFFNGRWAEKVESLKTQSAKDRWNDTLYRRSITIMDSRHLYEVLFELCDAIRTACTEFVRETCPPGSEGIVVSRRISDGCTVAWKAVDPDFTVRNHEKWRS